MYLHSVSGLHRPHSGNCMETEKVCRRNDARTQIKIGGTIGTRQRRRVDRQEDKCIAVIYTDALTGTDACNDRHIAILHLDAMTDADRQSTELTNGFQRIRRLIFLYDYAHQQHDAQPLQCRFSALNSARIEYTVTTAVILFRFDPLRRCSLISVQVRQQIVY